MQDKPRKGIPICPKCGWGARAAGVKGMASVRSVYGDKTAGGRMDRPMGRGGKVTSPFGKPRDKTQVMILAAVTLGLYGLYFWSLVVVRELRRLHGRKFPLVRYIIGLFLPPVLFTHLFLEIGELEYYRHERGMPKGISVGAFMGWWLLSAFLVALPAFLWAVNVLGTTAGWVLFGLGMVAYIGLQAWIFGRAQHAVNEIWHEMGNKA